MNLLRSVNPRALALAALGTLGAMTAWAADDPTGPATPQSIAAMQRVAQRGAAHFVRVEWTGRYDKGDPPGLMGGRDGAWRGAESWERAIREQRPLERTGIVLSPTRVLAADPMLHERFIESVSIRAGQTSVEARVAAIAVRQPALLLETAAPLKDVIAPVFDPSRPGPFMTLNHAPRENGWMVAAGSQSIRVGIASDGRTVIPTAPETLFVDESGTAVGATMLSELPADGSWKGSPEQWEWIEAARWDALRADLAAKAGQSLPRVQLTFRSPRGQSDHQQMLGDGGMSADAQLTEWNGTGVLLDDRTVLVLASLPSRTTARLERIRVAQQQGAEVAASFAGTLRDFGALLVRTEEPLAGAATPGAEPITSLRDRLLTRVDVEVHGESRSAYVTGERVGSFETGWQRMLMPAVAPPAQSAALGAGVRHASSFLFDLEGRLVAVSIARRERVALFDRTRRSPLGAMPLTPIGPVIEAVRAGQASLAPDNTPLPEAEESRLAWLGLELQPLDEQLARVSGVSDQTRGGQTGALVSFVYPDSPAAKAGIQMGDVLLRLRIDGVPRPMEVQLDPNPMEGYTQNFYSLLDQVPEEYFDQIPVPWGSAENRLAMTLTEAGFGTAFDIELSRDGAIVRIPMAVERGPAHFEAAPRHRSDELGLTVRDMTYEVRRFFQVGPDDPGVIISRVERGGRASIAGLKPFERITTINDEPIRTAADFARAIAPGGELRLSIRRMTDGRQVKLRVEPAR